MFDQAIADTICERLINGESLRAICRASHMPDRSTIVRWEESHPEFAAKCARAREAQAELMDDLILDAANECTEDNAQSTRVRIAAYQWRAAKLKPKRYGDKIIQEGDHKLTIELIDATKRD